MGWFDDQIKQRKENDNDIFTDSFVNIAGAVMGSRFTAAINDEQAVTKDAIDEILKYYRVKSQEVPANMKSINDQLEYLMRPYGIMRRTVHLNGAWYKDAVGAMLGAFREDGRIVALIPDGFSGYRYLDYKTGKNQKVNKNVAALFETEAIAFYKPLPLKKISLKELFKYIWQILQPSDYIAVCLAGFATALLGLILPKLNNIVFSDVVDSGNMALFGAVSVFLVCLAISTFLITSIKSLIISRIETKMSVSVQAAMMMRVLSMPADFFKNYSAGDLSNRIAYVNELCDMLVSTVFTTGLTAVFSILYVSQIFAYAPSLALPALLVLLFTIMFSLISAALQIRISTRQMELASKESGVSYGLISGIQKIKLAGAEKRAFARWGNLFAKQAELLYNPPTFIKVNMAINTAITLIGTIIIYYTAICTHVSAADYYAFHTAYSMVSGAFIALSEIASTAAQMKPIFVMVKPLLDTVPEISKEKQVLSRLSGSIELNNISFRYAETAPNIIDNLSLKIRPGQYVAIVGKTGCGKTTLMRLLLGLEKPQKGAIYYDGKDLHAIDLKSLRRKIGVVTQNGKLFQGNIFSNIAISAPQLTLDEAWEAAEMAGIAEDIRHMPMGMHTIVTEGSGGISGGQRQRLMIARAIAPKPRILMFDEATSALDNITQQKVSDALDSLKCTRIVIAHRLSTIKQCDRILVLDKGRIIEEGTYDELIKNGSVFAELVEHQELNK